MGNCQRGFGVFIANGGMWSFFGRGGQSKSGGEEGGARRRMSLLTQKRGLISQGGLAFCSKADKRQPSLCPGHEPTKEGHLGC